jgi:hypothetical protein
VGFGAFALEAVGFLTRRDAGVFLLLVPLTNAGSPSSEALVGVSRVTDEALEESVRDCH